MTGMRLPELKGKAVLITGASTGIGAALARAFAAQGARVGLHYNASEDAAKAVAYEIGAAGGEAVLIRADGGSGAGARSAVEQAVGAVLKPASQQQQQQMQQHQLSSRSSEQLLQHLRQSVTSLRSCSY